MQDTIYRQVCTECTQILTIKATPGGNVVFRVSDKDDDTISEFTADAAQGEYIAGQLNARLHRHQGYRNYETFTVCSTLDNDSDLQIQSVTIARVAAAGEEYPDVAAAKDAWDAGDLGWLDAHGFAVYDLEDPFEVEKRKTARGELGRYGWGRFNRLKAYREAHPLPAR